MKTTKKSPIKKETAAKAPKKSKELVIIEQSSGPLVKQANAIVIASEKDLVRATEVLSKLNIFNDQVIAYKEKKTKPLNALLKIIRDETRAAENELKEAISIVRDKLSEYQTALVEAQEKKELESADKGGSVQEQMNAVEAAGGDLIHGKVESKSGSLSFQAKQVVEIIDFKLIPFEYWLPNTEAMLKDMQEGKTVPGAAIKTIQVPINRRG